MTTNRQSTLELRLRRELQCEVLFDDFSRGRYSTDASIYQIKPIGVVIPNNDQEVQSAIQIAVDAGIPVLPRGGGTSQTGQAVGKALVIDTSKHLKEVLSFDAENRTVCVQPGLVLDQLNSFLKPHGLFFPVDVSTASRATIGGMSGNNSCGSRSIRYGNMVHNVRAIDALLADGTEAHFNALTSDHTINEKNARFDELVSNMRSLGQKEANEIAERVPKLLRRVGGYNIDTLVSDKPNMAHLLVGSEGTLAFFQRIHLDLQPIPSHKVLGVCHFPSFYQAMENTQHIVKLNPTAVELVDRTMIELARDIPMFKETVDRFVQGKPEALLLVEFAGEDKAKALQDLRQLVELMAELGFPGAVVEAIDPSFQQAVWEVRKSGLNIMMSMKGDGKPVSFIEDCAVELKDLADYTERLTEVFSKYGTTGTWYAHASVGCLHVRPILNMKEGSGAEKMRAIAEETMAIVREYKGSHSGEHGDGLARSEFHEAMFGTRMVKAFEYVKDSFDPAGVFNPGKIVRAERMDDRKLFRYPPGYTIRHSSTKLDWSAWGGFNGAVEMCNNNGACRKHDASVMCPSYRVTGDEKHLTRGRANTLRLAISGQLGEGAMTSDDMYESMSLCVSCKACKRECPTGVDMAKMKIEFMHHYHQHHSLSVMDRMIAYLPHYAHWASKLSFLINLRDQVPGLAKLTELLLGFSSKRQLPRWRRDRFKSIPDISQAAADTQSSKEVVLLVDTFNSCFEPENAHAAHEVLIAAGYQVHCPVPTDTKRPLCCGRTFLNSGLLEQAIVEAQRVLDTLLPYVRRGVPIIGLEPSCLLTLRDEFPSLLPGDETKALAGHAFLLEEFLAKEHRGGHLQLLLKPLAVKHALLHGHCHQKAFAVMSDVMQVLSLIPELEVETIETSCCGMAGSFGYDARYYDTSIKMGEQKLFPTVRDANASSLIIADGTSCRTQIRDGTGRQPLHVAQVLKMALDNK